MCKVLKLSVNLRTRELNIFNKPYLFEIYLNTNNKIYNILNVHLNKNKYYGINTEQIMRYNKT